VGRRFGRSSGVAPWTRIAGRVLAAGRVAVGGALIAAPDVATRRWLGEVHEEDPGRAIAVRGLGARDVVLGVGLLVALRSGTDARVASRWVEAGIVADLADAAATLAAGVSDAGRTASTAVALGAAGTGAVVRAGLR
jgi:hypothetical protein